MLTYLKVINTKFNTYVNPNSMGGGGCQIDHAAQKVVKSEKQPKKRIYYYL